MKTEGQAAVAALREALTAYQDEADAEWDLSDPEEGRMGAFGMACETHLPALLAYLAAVEQERDGMEAAMPVLTDRIVALERYDAELAACCKALERWPLASGCNGQLQVAGHLRAILEVVAEQDAEIGRLRAELKTTISKLSDVWLVLDEWARSESLADTGIPFSCEALLRAQQVPGWKGNP